MLQETSQKKLGHVAQERDHAKPHQLSVQHKRTPLNFQPSPSYDPHTQIIIYLWLQSVFALENGPTGGSFYVGTVGLCDILKPSICTYEALGTRQCLHVEQHSASQIGGSFYAYITPDY